MSRKALEKFNPARLKPGGSPRFFEVVNPQTHYHEVHYFFRDQDGELLSGVTHGFNNAHAEIKNWKNLKRAKLVELKQMELNLVSAGARSGGQESREDDQHVETVAATDAG